MPLDLKMCESAAEVTTAKDGYIQTVAGNGDHEQQASDFANGIAQWGKMFVRKHLFYYATDPADKAVVGLLRLSVEADMVHIANVTGAPKRGAGSELVELAKAVSLSLGKKGVNLCTADELLPGFYMKFGFNMKTPTAKQGEMLFLFNTD